MFLDKNTRDFRKKQKARVFRKNTRVFRKTTQKTRVSGEKTRENDQKWEKTLINEPKCQNFKIFHHLKIHKKI